jgi:2'-5' RNA ligase
MCKVIALTNAPDNPPKSHRAFLAIDATMEAAEALAALAPRFPGVKLLPGGRPPHLTMRFLGNLSEAQLERVKEECRKIRVPAFKLSVKGLGVFRQGRSREVFWAGLAPSGPLEVLREAVDAALMASLELRPEKRFWPHLTLARARRSGDGLKGPAAEAGQEILAEFMAEELRLYKSLLTPQAAVHTLLAAWPLGVEGQTA